MSALHTPRNRTMEPDTVTSIGQNGPEYGKNVLDSRHAINFGITQIGARIAIVTSFNYGPRDHRRIDRSRFHLGGLRCWKNPPGGPMAGPLAPNWPIWTCHQAGT